jgi:flagellar FliL protein
MAEAEKAEGAKPSGNKKVIIIAVVAALVAVGAAVGVTLMLTGKDKGKADKEAAAQTEEGGGEAAAEGEGGHGEGDAKEGEDGGEGGEGGERAKVAYLSLAPAFVVNFQPGPAGEKPKAKFLSVEIDVVVGDPTAVEPIKEHMPALRNSVIMLLSRQTYDELIKPEGKEKLRTDVLDEIQKTLKKAMGKKAVKEVFFTSFVMQ